MEFYSVMRSIRAIEYSDVCLLIVDAERGFEAQDQRIFHIADRNKKGIVILVNKWDLIEKNQDTVKEFEEKIRKTHEAEKMFNDAENMSVHFASPENRRTLPTRLEFDR